MTQKTLAGIFSDPDGTPVAGIKILFTLLNNSADSFMRRYSLCVTDSSGAYSISLSNGIYGVSTRDNAGKSVNLGVINIDETSVDGTLNSYLLAGSVSQPDPILTAIQAAYQQMSELKDTPVFTVADYAAIPANPAGMFLVLDDETKGDVPAMYLFASGRRFWMAMVEDTQ